LSKSVAVVTGGAGFIGSHLAARLDADGYSVRVLDDLSTGDAANLAALGSAVDVVEGSLLDDRALEETLRGARFLFHQAAVPSVGRSMANPLRSHEANVTGTIRLLEAARAASVERVVYASSSSVYGGAHPLPVREDLEPRPVSPYAVSKLSGEYYCRCYFSAFGLQTVCLRYFNVFGPRQSFTSDYAAVIPRFARALLRGEPITIFGDGEQSRDFTYIDNVVEANLLAAAASEPAHGRVFNVASGTRFSLNEVVRMLSELTGAVDPQIDFAEPRAGDVRHSQADISAATSFLGYSVVVPFEDGLKLTLDWVDSQP
jgi:UDP-glucose 4-epimerase